MTLVPHRAATLDGFQFGTRRVVACVSGGRTTRNGAGGSRDFQPSLEEETVVRRRSWCGVCVCVVSAPSLHGGGMGRAEKERLTHATAHAAFGRRDVGTSLRSDNVNSDKATAKRKENENMSEPNSNVKASKTVTLTKDKDCRGSVRFSNAEPLAALSSVYVNRTFFEVNQAKVIRVTVEVVE